MNYGAGIKRDERIKQLKTMIQNYRAVGRTKLAEQKERELGEIYNKMSGKDTPLGGYMQGDNNGIL